LYALANLSPMSTDLEPKVHRWTRAEYDQVVALGVFDHRRIELLDGELIDMAPISNRHYWTVNYLARELTLQLDQETMIVGIQGPFALSDDSEPEPDVVVYRHEAELWKHDHATPSEAVLIVEVALTSWAYDSGRKLQAYARGGLPEVWLVDLNRDVVHVCRQPIDDIYTERFVVDRNGSLTVPNSAVTIEVASFLR
jgi:Uma2 family endonuclease